MHGKVYREAVEEAAEALAESWVHADAGCAGDAALSKKRAGLAIEALKRRGGDWKQARGEACRRALEIYSEEA